jgi:DNA modification methylase
MHRSEHTIRLRKKIVNSFVPSKAPAVELISLPFYASLESVPSRRKLIKDLQTFLDKGNEESTFVIFTSPIFATEFSTELRTNVHLKLWIAVKLSEPFVHENKLDEHHAALLIITKTASALNHTKTRIAYSYCPACDKTTKDYGGKKHIYHEYGTLMSDVWRDISIAPDGNLSPISDRLQDLFGINKYKWLLHHDLRQLYPSTNRKQIYRNFNSETNQLTKSLLLNGDCIDELRKLPDNSIDFCFADPPYNLKKKYESWDDGIDIQTYFEWCDLWLSELARVLKPGCTLAILNIPQWCVRHFKYLITVLDYQDWIVWEGLSMPVRMIMPSHYSILCFSKGTPRSLPSANRISDNILEVRSTLTLKENYCIRGNCVTKRNRQKINDTQSASNMWWDIHRLKHNSRRVDHPCQLPPNFMHRLISTFTNFGEFILDPFNGAGTSTLCAEQMGRNFIGIELSEYYHGITVKRHEELRHGIDPFRKVNDNSPKAKNSPIERLRKQKYHVSKKTLQLEVRRIANELGRMPTKEDVSRLSSYPMEYYDNYFISWGEVMAAARTTGMTEDRFPVIQHQLKIFI